MGITNHRENRIQVVSEADFAPSSSKCIILLSRYYIYNKTTADVKNDLFSVTFLPLKPFPETQNIHVRIHFPPGHIFI